MTLNLEPFWAKHYTNCVIICYWFLGMCNNFAYVIMLSAANDILSDEKKNTTPNGSLANLFFKQTENNSTNKYDCNSLSTGTVLLADILPGIIATTVFSSILINKIKYTHRVLIVITGNIISYLIVATTPSDIRWLVFVGVGFASFSCSFGEITFLAMASSYSRKLSIAGWGSGTGGAGLVGSFGYAGLTSIGLSPQNTIFVCLTIPAIMALAYTILPSIEFAESRGQLGLDNEEIENTHTTERNEKYNNSKDTESVNYSDNIVNSSTSPIFSNQRPEENKLVKTWRVVRPMLKYMIPLFFVYYAEYFINQGLFELLYFKDSFIKEHKIQYRWYQVLYQAAVFVSRSSIRFVKINYLPIFPILQIMNVLIVLSQIYFGYFADIWVAFILIFWEGLLGGGCYVNAFNRISVEIPKEVREYSIAATCIVNNIGIALAGVTAIPVHNAICKYGGFK